MIGYTLGALLCGRARCLSMAVLAAAMLALGACGGGSTDAGAPPSTPPGLSEDELEALGSDPAVMRMGDILERSDGLLFSSLHAHYALFVDEATQPERLELVERMDCTGGRCEAEDGSAVTVEDLTSPAALEAGLSEAVPGSVEGFDTVLTRSGYEVTETQSGVTVTADVSATGYGFWGEHGYGALELLSGPLTGEVEGTAFSGDFQQAMAYAAGDVSGSNPAGSGSATWRGMVEASPTGAFERLQGTATVTIADLALPRVGVAIEVPGHDIGAPGWADMALENGGFASGTAGSDRLVGNFHGPGHEEAWGVFDTEDYIGAFGTKRVP